MRRPRMTLFVLVARCLATGGRMGFLAMTTRRPQGNLMSLRASRREAMAALASLVTASSARAVDLTKTEGSGFGVDEDQPFRAALEQIGSLLDKLGVEGAVERPRNEQAVGPTIERKYVVGPKPGTDRLRACPEGEVCLSSSRNEKADCFVSPYVYFDQKGDAVGLLIEALYNARDAQLLTARGNFFNGAGVYALAECVSSPSCSSNVATQAHR